MYVDTLRDPEKLFKCEVCGAFWQLEGLQKYAKILHEASDDTPTFQGKPQLKKWEKKAPPPKSKHGIGFYLFWLILACAIFLVARYYYAKEWACLSGAGVGVSVGRARRLTRTQN